jgi:hypothetical protein
MNWLNQTLCAKHAFAAGKGIVLAATLAGALGSNAIAAAPATNSVNSLDESSFRIISERNIFNSRRSARYVASAPRTRPSRVENFALVGTLAYDKGPFAFFEGSRSEYRKVLKAEDTIAGFKVLAVEPSSVKLASPTNEIEMRVGMQLRREDEGEWHLSERPEVLEPSPNRSSYTRSASPPASPASTAAAPGPGAVVAEGQLPEGSYGFGPDGGPIGFIDPQTGLTNVPVVIPLPPDGGGGPGGDVLELLRRRAAAERGEAP